MQVARAVFNYEHVCCGNYNFEQVKEFCYLGLQTNQTNCISSEIQARILSGNRCYYGYGKLIKSRASPVQNEDGSWRIRMNHELNELIENADSVRFIKCRITWLCHVKRMDDKRTPKKNLE